MLGDNVWPGDHQTYSYGHGELLANLALLYFQVLDTRDGCLMTKEMKFSYFFIYVFLLSLNLSASHQRFYYISRAQRKYLYNLIVYTGMIAQNYLPDC